MSRDTKTGSTKLSLRGQRGPGARRFIPRGNQGRAFSLATKERSFNPNTRETRDFTEWHRIVVWNKLADFAEKYVTQGKQLLVEGKLRTRKWQDRSGNQRSTTEIEAQSIILLGRRPDHRQASALCRRSCAENTPRRGPQAGGGRGRREIPA
jgi:single-strand DNA-binding protein